jgi:hypothetical protein
VGNRYKKKHVKFVYSEMVRIRRGSRVKIARIKTPGRPGGRPKNILPSYRTSWEFQTIFRDFLLPFFDALTPDLPLKDKAELLFCSSTRDVVLAVLTKNTDMPGRLWNTGEGTYRPATVLERKFLAGTPVYVRLDDTMPDRVDIECGATPEFIFSLTKVEYLSIVGVLEEVNKCNHRLLPADATAFKIGGL